MVNTFGLNGDSGPDSASIGWSGIEVPEYAAAYVSTISQTRDELRTRARSSKGINAQELHELGQRIPDTADGEDATGAPYRRVLQDFRIKITNLQESPNLPKEVLALCDRIRDVDLWDTGIYLEDRDGEPALIRPVTRELRAARTEKEDQVRQKQLKKEEREREAAAKLEKGRLDPLLMFRTSEYSAWTEEGVEQGLPTKDAQGADIVKSRRAKLKKEQAAQKKLHEAWLKANPPTKG